jgi:hypothetical protein
VGLQEIAEPLDIEGHDLMAGGDQLGNQHRPLVAAGPRHEDFHIARFFALFPAATGPAGT